MAALVGIRSAARPDAEAIADIAVRSWRQGFAGIVPERIDPRQFWNAERVAERFTEPVDFETTVAMIDGAVGGFVVLGSSRDADAADDVGEVRALFVDPDGWRQGVGRALVEAAVDALRRFGYAEVTVWTLAECPRNISFYEATGFRLDGAQQRRDDLGRPLEVRLRLPL